MALGERIKHRRKYLNMTVEALADKIGVSTSTCYRYESGYISKIDSDTLLRIADALQTTPGYLMGLIDVPWNEKIDDDVPSDLFYPFPGDVRPVSSLHMQRVPMIGEVAAGEPIYAPEDMGVYVNSPVNCDAAITIHGDSMSPTYQDGDVVYIKCVPDVPEGAVAVIFLDDEAAIKHVYKRPTGLTLWSDNPNYMPKQIEFEDYTNVRIFGVPVGFTRIYKK